MSIKTCIVKTAVKWTPNIIIVSAANIILKDIAKFSDFILDLDSRTAYVCLTLKGEAEPIEVSVDGFAFISEQGTHQLFIEEAQSNKIWLNNALSRIVGKALKIPEIPKYKAHIDFLADLFKAENQNTEDSN